MTTLELCAHLENHNNVLVDTSNLSKIWMVLAALLISQLVWALDPGKALHQYRQDQWSTPEGLPQVTVLAITQDRDHFIWLGTQVGLARFDGREFRVFNAENDSGLSNNYVNSLLALDDGSVWIATRGGISRFSDHKVEQVLPLASTGVVHQLLSFKDHVYAATDNGLVQFDLANIGNPNWIFQRATQRVGLIDGELAFSAGTALWRYADDGRLSTLAELQAPLTHFYNDKQGYAWLGTERGLWHWRDGKLSQPIAHPALRSRLIEAVWHDRDDNLWVASDVGWFRLRYARLGDEVQRMNDRWARSLFEDHEGNLWVGSTTEGVARYWNGYLTRIGDEEGIAEPLIWGLYQDQSGTIFAQSQNGVYQQIGDRFALRYSPEQLPHPNALAALKTRDGTFWVGTAQGLAAFQQGKRVHQELLKPLENEKLYSLVETDEALWIGARNGLYRIQDGKLYLPSAFAGIPPITVRGMIVDKDKRLWVGTSSGLFQWQNGAFTKIASDLPLGSEFISAMYVDPTGTLWVGTQNSGLFRFRQNQWTMYNTVSGLHSNTVFYINSIGDKLWLTSHRGIFFVEFNQFAEMDSNQRQRLSSMVYGASNRTDRAECNGGHLQAGLVDDKGRLYCPTIDGIVMIDPSRLSAVPFPPKLHITNVRFTVDGVQQRVAGNKAELPAGAHNIEIDYVATSYREPMFTQYQYRISDNDKSWIDAGTRNTAYFHSLPPDNYTFEVRAQTDDGVSAQNNATLMIKLAPYYYQTWWFRALLVLAAISLFVALFVWRYRLLQANKQRLEHLVEQRTRELTLVNEQLQKASSTDPLTQLGNRRYVVERVPHDVALSRRAHIRQIDPDNRDIVFVMLDIDHFKQINDRYGHAVGDLVLAEVGKRISGVIRDSDYAVRWGGEEFMVVGRCANHHHSMHLPERLLRAVSGQPIWIGGDQKLNVTCSLGFAHYPFWSEDLDALNWEQIVTIADAALYIAKSRGRDRWIGIEAGDLFEPNDLVGLQNIQDYLRLVDRFKLRLITEVL